MFGRFPELRSRADRVLGYSIEKLCLENPERRLSKTEYAQPAIYVVNALHHLAAQEDLPPADYFAGHSLGEYNALFAAGAFDFDTGLALVRRRAELMGRAAAGGAMAAVVGLSEEAVERALREHDATGVVIANYNAPEQFVVSGSKEELARIRPVIEGLPGVRGFVPVRVGGAFHSPRMAAAAEEFRDFLASMDVAGPRVPVVSNVTGRPFDTDAAAVRASLAEQIVRPVRWIDCVRFLRGAGVSVFTELSDSRVLTPLIDKIIAAGESASDPRRELIDRIKREILQPEIGGAALDFGDEQSFRELGLNSIVYVRVARKVQTVLGVAVKPDVIFQHRSCAALADYLLALDGGDGGSDGGSRGGGGDVGIGAARTAEPASWREYQDERVSALLRDCADGNVTVDQVVETLRAGAAHSARRPVARG
ncbi:MAG: acyltransferase domain-containing protein [Catenulispora sp.]